MSAKNGKPTYVPRKTSNTTTYVLGAVALVVIAVVVIGGVIWQTHRSKPRNDGYGSVQNSQVQVQLQDKGVIRLGQQFASKTIDLYEDAMCPYCAQLEQTNGQEIAQAIDDGKLAVNYHMVDFLNQLSNSGDYSTRAVAASECVAEGGDAIAFGKFHAQLFSKDGQPKEHGSSDHTNDELATFAKDAGAKDTVTQCISSGSKVADAKTNATGAAQQLTAMGGQGTPSVFQGTTAVDTQKSSWVADLQ
ncbi:DsbA family protein [Antrihabitans cavernicola]|uniref:DsbA family protein n=1 Tax=Antrihabitans cavernicola TaxID=2495913 RepID=A0A5A7SHK5_9NOCA|nr:thioredoxin domain-containing protein [Spelaeibacter cavernicola]KAA0024093.1 DsbA family protein [Spelaeibacter cavernicola]